MTAEQIRLVRDLRQFESHICMEAAREIERQAAMILELGKEIADLSREIRRLNDRALAHEESWS